MTETDKNVPYRKQVFVCTNERSGGGRVSCGEKKGMLLVAKFKKLIKEKGLKAEIRAQRTGCFDFCEYGPVVVIYPEGIAYGKVNANDVEPIMEQHLVREKPLKELQIDFNKVPEQWKPD